MKVCIFTETYYPVMGGGETQAQILADGLIASGNSVIILTRRSDSSLKLQENLNGAIIHRLPPVGSGQLKKWGLVLSSLPMLIQLRNQYDLIFVSGYRIIGITAVIAGKLFRKSTILKADSQGEMSGEFFESGLKRFGRSRSGFLFRLFLSLRNSVLRNADAFSAISTDITSELISNRIPEKKIHRIPNSVDTKFFHPVDSCQKTKLRAKLNLPQMATIAIYTGRLVSYKGLPVLLKVWKEIRSRNDNVLLVLAGTGGLDIHNCETELQEYVKDEDLSPSVLFTGAVNNVFEYLQASDIFIFPTENDAFPSSLIEAMACALPVVTTPVGAIKTIVQDKKNGLLVEPGNPQQISTALENLISDHNLAFQLGQAAQETVQHHYSSETVTNQYLSLFQNILHFSARFSSDVD